MAAGDGRGIPKWTFVMAAAILVMAYPAYIGLRQLISAAGPATAPLVIIHLESAVRDASAVVPTKAVLPESEWTGLMFWVPVSNVPDVNYQYRLLRGTVQVLAQENIKSIDGLGNFLLSIRTAQLQPGAIYDLIVSETGGNHREWRFFFILQR